MENNNLYHHGTKGMRWGHRRYQNKDGTLTEAGKKRYGQTQAEAGKDSPYKKKSYDDLDEYQRKALGDKWVTNDLNAGKQLADSGQRMTSDLRRINENEGKRHRSKHQMDLSHMSDKEMRDAVNRAYLERQYNDLYNPANQQRGRERVDRMLDVCGSVLTIGSTSLAIALAIKQLKVV